MVKLLITFVVLVLCAAAAGGQVDVERSKIEYLISSVEGLQGTKFIRNGVAYDGKEAAAHLRMKLKRAGPRVRTAEDFIRVCASKSYLSGRPYSIKLPNGKEIMAEEFFTKALKKYHSPESPNHPKP